MIITNDQLMSLLEARKPTGFSGRDNYDGAQCLFRDINHLINLLPDDADYDARSLWIDNVETLLGQNLSGIRWIADGEDLTVCDEGQVLSADNGRIVQLAVNTVVPFVKVLTNSDKMVTHLIRDNARMCHVHAKVPDRIVDAMSAFVYGALKMKIPEKQRTLLTGIRVNDGFALVRAIRSTVDGVTESPLSILAQRKQSLKLSGLDGYVLYPG